MKAAWAEGAVIGKTFRYQGEKVRDFILSLVGNVRPEVMVISSVYEIPVEDETIYAGKCSRLLILDSAHRNISEKCGLPHWITYDRTASMLAVRHLFPGKGCTVMDFGTTFTVDFISADGKYEGGNISLGCRTRFKAVNRYSRALPLIDTPEDIPELGHSMQTAVASGAISGIMFEIDGYVSFRPGNIIVFTGGDANYFAKRTKNSIFVICNLVLMGLALIADGYAD